MKIIQVVAHYPPNFGGLQNIAKELSEKLSKRGHQVKVLTSNIRCPKDKQLKSKEKLKITYLRSWEIAHTPIIPSLFWKLMKIPKDSIIHVHAAQALTPEIVWLVSKFRKIPYIAHVHGNASPSGKLGIFLTPYKKIFLKKILKDADKIITLNEDYKDLIIKKYGINSSKIIIIPNATDFKRSKKIKTAIHSPINLLFVGRLSVEKNIPKLIEASSLLNQKITLHIVGEGEKREEIEDIIKRNNLTNVLVHGRKEGEKLINFYKNSDIFCLPSQYESFGVVALEAMAHGLPIVASNVEGLRTVVKNNYNGLLVEPTPEKIAEAIQKLIDNPKLRKRLAENGLKEVKKYSWDKIVKQTEEVYRGVLNESHKK